MWLENQKNQTKNKSWDAFSFYGEYPTSFVLTLEGYTGGTLTISSKKDPKEFEDLSITIPTTTAGKLTWDSATGLVKINDELISYSGKGYGTVLGEVLISITNMPALKTATIDYKALTY